MATSGRFKPTEVLRLTSSGAWPHIADYSTKVLADYPQLYWKLNDTGSTALDSSGNSRNGTIYNATSTTGFSTELGAALSFNASNTYVQGSWADNYTAGLSLEAVVKPGTQTDVVGVIISKSTFYADSFSNFPVSLYASPLGSIGFSLSTGNDYSAENTFTYSYSADTWYHVVGVFQQNGTSGLYINGTLVDSAITNYPLSSSNRNWTVGRHALEYSGGLNNSNYVGLIQHVAVYSFPLSEDRIAAHYLAMVD